MTDAEEYLQQAVQLHSTREFKKGFKSAENARKKFVKEKNLGRAMEALRVMGDCTINLRDLKKAKELYDQLLVEALGMKNLFYQAAALWGLGQVASHQMNHPDATHFFQRGLELARSIGDNWYTGWNAFGLANSLRGMGRLDEARPLLNDALSSFNAMNQSTLVSWVERVLGEIGGESASVPTDGTKMWLCPMCGSKFTQSQANELKRGKTATCEYCGTTVG